MLLRQRHLAEPTGEAGFEVARAEVPGIGFEVGDGPIGRFAGLAKTEEFDGGLEFGRVEGRAGGFHLGAEGEVGGVFAELFVVCIPGLDPRGRFGRAVGEPVAVLVELREEFFPAVEAGAFLGCADQPGRREGDCVSNACCSLVHDLTRPVPLAVLGSR